MLRTISTVCIFAAIGLLIIALLRPVDTKLFMNGVLNTFIATPLKNLPAKIVTDEGKTSNALFPFFNLNNDIRDSHIFGTPITTENVILKTNEQRRLQGLAPLVVNEKLVESAKLKVLDMIDEQYFEHTSPLGKSVSDLGDEVGYRYVIMGENLALGNFINSEELVGAWMKSEGHRENILNNTYTEIGVYAMKASYQGQVVWFAVQHFGTPRAACPAISQTLRQQITQANAELKIQEKLIYQKRNEFESQKYESGEEYEKKVQEFNLYVKEYNDALANSQKKITQYNAQVKAFNNCLAQYQGK